MTDHDQLRSEVTETLDALDAGPDAEPTFSTPWQARAFAITVALTDGTDFEWDRFQEFFVDRIQSVDEAAMQRDVEGVYYEQWLDALEELLVESGTISEADIDGRQAEFEAGDREASEFVVEELPDTAPE